MILELKLPSNLPSLFHSMHYSCFARLQVTKQDHVLCPGHRIITRADLPEEYDRALRPDEIYTFLHLGGETNIWNWVTVQDHSGKTLRSSPDGTFAISWSFLAGRGLLSRTLKKRTHVVITNETPVFGTFVTRNKSGGLNCGRRCSLPTRFRWYRHLKRLSSPLSSKSAL